MSYAHDEGAAVPVAPAPPEPERPARRHFTETGHTVSGAFLAFLEHYGVALAGFPITEEWTEGGVRSQLFQNIALEETADGRVRLKPLGEAWLSMERERATADVVPPLQAVVDVVDRLPRSRERTYEQRPLSDIRYIVLHHTGASAETGVQDIATEHVETNGWPGIGYHFVIDLEGTVYRTQDLTTVSFHARQFNPAAVGIALVGDLTTSLPTAAQLDRTADTLARLLGDLGLPLQAVRGHREMVGTPCPGETFLAVWKPRLLRAVEARLRGEPGGRTTESPAPPPRW